MTRPDPPDLAALAAASELLRDGVKEPTSTELDGGLNALRTRIVAGERRHAPRRWAVLAMAMVVCVVLGAGFVRGFRKGPSVSGAPVTVNRIEGGRVLDGGYLSESGHGGIRLFFNEGSRFVLMPGARGRLRAVTAQGARLAIEHGTASFQITQSPEHRWSVEAGPFLVTVKGTDFSVFWDPANEQFELRLRRGRVAVSGPVVGEDFVLRAGQKLSVSLPKAETVITEERPEPAVPKAPAPIASPAASSPLAAPEGSVREAKGPGAPAPQPSAASAGTGAERRWKEALASGQWDRILADVERDGVGTTLQTISSDDLFALADAARYRRRADLARAALLAQRRRFPSSVRSLDALFLLGRVEESRAGGSSKAIQWYEEYLAAAPAGTYAAEALGRKMILSNELGQPAKARQIAKEYLQRFPEGSYAGAARALQRVP